MRMKTKTDKCYSAQLLLLFRSSLLHTVSLGLLRSYTTSTQSSFFVPFSMSCFIFICQLFSFHGLEHNVVYMAAIRPKFTIGQMKSHCLVALNATKYKTLLFMRTKQKLKQNKWSNRAHFFAVSIFAQAQLSPFLACFTAFIKNDSFRLLFSISHGWEKRCSAVFLCCKRIDGQQNTTTAQSFSILFGTHLPYKLW